MEKKLIAIVGPTASGKTSVAAKLAIGVDGEIISGDSRQVYRRMDIGTGKDLSDYRQGDVQVATHLIDICEPGEKYTVFNYKRDFFKAYDDIMARGKQPILCGGSGLYIEAALKDYDMPDVPPDDEIRSALKGKSIDELAKILASYRPLHNVTDIDTAQRAIRAIEIERYKQNRPVEYYENRQAESIVFGLQIDREHRRQRITERLKARLADGMIDEVGGLLREGLSPDALIYYGLEYKYVTLYLTGRLSYDEMFVQLEIAIHQFAKRQMTWFRGMERRGCHIHWIDAMLPDEEKLKIIMSYII